MQPSGNQSLAAGNADLARPNRSPRPRLRSVRWVSEPSDAPDPSQTPIRSFPARQWLPTPGDTAEVYPLGPGRLGRPIFPSSAATMTVQCRDRAHQAFDLGLWIHKEPHVRLALLRDRARTNVLLTSSIFFHVYLVTNLGERAALTFELSLSRHDPTMHVSDGSEMAVASSAGVYIPRVEIEEGAVQNLSLDPGEAAPEVHLSEESGQTVDTEAGAHAPRLEVSDQVQVEVSTFPGEAAPVVMISEAAAETLESREGAYFLKFRVQELLESAVQDLLSSTGDYAEGNITVPLSDGAVLGVNSSTGQFKIWVISDTFEGYAYPSNVNGLAGGQNWSGAFVARSNLFGGQMYDMFETYTLTSLLSGLNEGHWVDGPFVSRENLSSNQYYETFESYTVSNNLNGLNGGVGFTGAFAARNNISYLNIFDTFNDYSLSADLNGLNAGTGFAGAFVSRDNI